MVNANKIRTVPDIELTKFSSIKINLYINYTTNCAKSQPILINYSQNRDFTHSLFSVLPFEFTSVNCHSSYGFYFLEVILRYDFVKIFIRE